MKPQPSLHVHWLSKQHTSPGRLGITTLPGRKDKDRNLRDDLEALQAVGISYVVPLITDHELPLYGVEDLFAAYQDAGFTIRRLPIPDMGISSQGDMAELVAWLDEKLRTGARVLIHCVGGLGRSGMAAACYLKAKGLDTETAIAEVRRSRSPHAIETPEQEALVRHFSRHSE